MGWRLPLEGLQRSAQRESRYCFQADSPRASSKRTAIVRRRAAAAEWPRGVQVAVGGGKAVGEEGRSTAAPRRRCGTGRAASPSPGGPAPGVAVQVVLGPLVVGQGLLKGACRDSPNLNPLAATKRQLISPQGKAKTPSAELHSFPATATQQQRRKANPNSNGRRGSSRPSYPPAQTSPPRQAATTQRSRYQAIIAF